MPKHSCTAKPIDKVQLKPEPLPICFRECRWNYQKLLIAVRSSISQQDLESMFSVHYWVCMFRCPLP